MQWRFKLVTIHGYVLLWQVANFGNVGRCYLSRSGRGLLKRFGELQGPAAYCRRPAEQSDTATQCSTHGASLQVYSCYEMLLAADCTCH
jgi:hypothetical protein